MTGVQTCALPISSDEIVISNRRFSLFSTTHSASDSFGFVLRTELGNIVYTGDYITDYTSIKHHIFDFAKVASIANERNTLLLLSESSGADKIGICAPNHRLTPHIKTLVEEQSQRLFIAVYSQNFYSIQEVIDLAIENNKKIVIVNERFAKALPEINQTDTLVFPRGTLIQANEAIRYSSRDIIVLVLGTGEELFDLITSLATGSYTDKTLYIKPDDRFVLACPPVPGTEKIATDALDAVYQTGSEVLNLTRKQISSMHAHEEDIKMMLALFKPKYFLPIKGEYRHLMQNAKIALSTGLGFNYSNTIILDNGMQITIDSSKTLLPKINKVESGDLVVSGKVIAKNDGAILRERNRLADEGIVCLTVAVSSKQQRIISQPEIQMRGFIYLGDQRSVYQEIYQMFLDTIHELMAKRMMTTSDAEKKLVDKLGKYLTKQIKKNPYLEVNIINIDEKDIV